MPRELKTLHLDTAPFDPRHTEDMSPIAALVAEGEVIGNIRDPEVKEHVDREESWTSLYDRFLEKRMGLSPAEFKDLYFGNFELREYQTEMLNKIVSGEGTDDKVDAAKHLQFCSKPSPPCDFVVMTWDTAKEPNKLSDVANGSQGFKPEFIWIKKAPGEMITWDLDEQERVVQEAFDGGSDEGQS